MCVANYLLYGNLPYNLFLNPNISSITATFFLDILYLKWYKVNTLASGYANDTLRVACFPGVVRKKVSVITSNRGEMSRRTETYAKE